jgi:hypothetical protein
MVLAWAASQAIYAGCYIALYIAIHHPGSFPVGSPQNPAPGWLKTQIVVYCVVLFFTLLGGFLKKPATRLQP